jgi:aryl-alcohol dehydrogenase-like predicted oxidoreductase
VAAAKGWTPFCASQVEWTLLSRDVEEAIVPAAEGARMGIAPYFPLASGLLTGNYRRGEPFPDGTRFAMMDYLAGVATEQAF